MAICCDCIIKGSHIMDRSGPSTKHKCEPHVKVAGYHNILRGPPFPTQMLHEQILRHHTRYMSSIDCPYAITEVGIEPTAAKSRMHNAEFWILRLYDVGSKP